MTVRIRLLLTSTLQFQLLPPLDNKLMDRFPYLKFDLKFLFYFYFLLVFYFPLHSALPLRDHRSVCAHIEHFHMFHTVLKSLLEGIVAIYKTYLELVNIKR